MPPTCSVRIPRLVSTPCAATPFSNCPVRPCFVAHHQHVPMRPPGSDRAHSPPTPPPSRSDAGVQGRTGSEPVRTLNCTILTRTASAGQPSSAQGRFRFSKNWEGAEPVRTWFEPPNRLPSRVRVRRISPTISFFSHLVSSKECQGVTDKVGSWVAGRTGEQEWAAGKTGRQGVVGG